MKKQQPIEDRNPLFPPPPFSPPFYSFINLIIYRLEKQQLIEDKDALSEELDNMRARYDSISSEKVPTFLERVFRAFGSY